MDRDSPAGQYLHLILQDRISPVEGGIENIAYYLARHLHDRGARVAVAGQIDRAVFLNSGIDIFSLKKPYRTRNTSDPRLLILLLRLRLKYGPNVILYSMLINNVKVFRWIKPVLGWKCVSFLHGNEVLRMYRARRDTLDRSIQACLCVIANSRYTKDYVQKIRQYPNVVIVSPGIDPQIFADYTGPDFREEKNLGERKIILMLSRLVKRKGHETVIRALGRLLPKHPDITLLVAGKGGYRRAIESMIQSAGLEDNTAFLGAVSEQEKLSLYKACDVYCMPSEVSEEQYEVEGFGITFIEAAAMGRIAIGTRSGGIPDAVEDGRSGFLIEPGDDSRLASILDEVFSDPHRFDGVRQYARERALTRFNWDCQIERILEAVTGNLS